MWSCVWRCILKIMLFTAYFCWNNNFLMGLTAKIRLHGLLLGKADNISNPQSSQVGVFLRKVIRRIRSKVRVKNCALKWFVFQTVCVKTSRLKTDERLTAKAKVHTVGTGNKNVRPAEITLPRHLAEHYILYFLRSMVPQPISPAGTIKYRT